MDNEVLDTRKAFQPGSGYFGAMLGPVARIISKGTVMTDQPSMPIAAIELQEFLFAETAQRCAESCESEKKNVVDWRPMTNHIRAAFRLQRFAVMNWLLLNGVSIPSHLLSDATHPPVGSQYPDQVSKR